MPRNTALFSLVAIAATLTASQAAQAQFATSGNLTAAVTSLRNGTGQVCFSLFDSSKGFPNDKESIVETKCVSAAPQTEPDAQTPTEQDAAAENSDAQSLDSQELAVQSAEALEPAAVDSGTDSEAMDSGVIDLEATDPEVEVVDSDTQTTEALGETVSVTFESLPLGTYAVSVFHDENEDGQINQGGFGIPLEGFGFSQNPAITTRAPEFSETAVIVVGAQTTTEIEMIYY